MFSVLLSIYHKELPSFLTEALNSVLNQSLKAGEIVIVEDGPLTADLYAVLHDFCARFNTIKRVPLKENAGLGNALNEGLKHCSYDLVARMDTDDIAYPDRFEKQVKFMQEHPEIDACSGWIEEFMDTTDNIVAVKKLPETHEELLKYAKRRSPLNHPAVMFRKKAVTAAGGYYGFPEDYNLWARMLMNGSKIHNLQESLLYFRYSPEVMKRRGGWRYAVSDFKSQCEFHRMGFIGTGDFAYNIAIRITMRLLPNRLRAFIYKRALRK